MATKNIIIKVRLHWFDFYIFIPMIKLLSMAGCNFDLTSALSAIKSRVKAVKK